VTSHELLITFTFIHSLILFVKPAPNVMQIENALDSDRLPFRFGLTTLLCFYSTVKRKLSKFEVVTKSDWII
jgi:hypothetical protein